jgi:hypothetical protein
MCRRISQKGGLIDCNIQARKVKIRAIWPQSKIGINIGIILGSYWDHIGIILDKTFRPYQVVIFYIIFGKEVQHPKKTENPP